MPGASAESLRRVPLFAELESIAGSMHEANVPAGAIVTAEGGPGDGFRESKERARRRLACALL